MKKVVIIFGYNNTRIYDVEKIKKMAAEQLDASIMLCKDQITQADRDLAPYTVELTLEIDSIEALNTQVQRLDKHLQEEGLVAVACLPFSDRGVPLGSAFARHCGLTHDEVEPGFGCVNKYVFRCNEKRAQTPSWYKKPAFAKLHSFEEAKALLLSVGKPLFFKPTCEGNSRGCVKISDVTDLEAQRKELDAYFAAGVIAEECIEGCQEYSFDGVGNFFTITEKETTKGSFRAETQHIMPAPLERVQYDRLIEAGKIVSQIAGSKGGAVHNELFLNKETNEVYCVEPNRRPAGVKLWDWIEVATGGESNWKNWISWSAGIPLQQDPNREFACYVGIRMLRARSSGSLVRIDAEIVNRIKELEDVVDVGIYKKVGDKISSELTQNGDFIGHVTCKNKSVQELRRILMECEAQIATAFVTE